MIVTSVAHARRVFARFAAYPDWSIDTETVPAPEYAQFSEDALVYARARIKIWSLCHRGESYSFPTNMYDPSYPTMSDYTDLVLPYATLSSIIKVFHNANYDLNVFFTSTGLRIFKPVWDTMIGAWMSNVALEKGLKSRAPLYGRSLGSLYISKKMQKAGFSAVSMETLSSVAMYAEEDVITTDELYQMQRFGFVSRQAFIPHINANGIIVEVANRLPKGRIIVPGEGLNTFKRLWISVQELPYLQANLRAERRGFPFDVPNLLIKRAECNKDKQVLMKRLYQAAGEVINLNSTPQIVKKIFEPNGIECKFRTKKDKVSLNADALFRMRELHPLVATLEDYRKKEKLMSVYLGDPEPKKKKTQEEAEGLAHFINPDGRIHCTMNTIGAVTGRTSAQNPNLTQIPSRQDVYGIKSLFQAPPGKVLLCLDYAQLEIRIMAILCKDPLMEKILGDPNGDIHQNTADRFGVDRSPTAKQLNFLMLYGGGAYMLAEKLTTEGVPTSKTESQVYIDTYNDVYFRVHQYRKELLEEHQANGFVRLLNGRTRHLADINWDDHYSVHQAETTLSNNVVQGSGQDSLKASIIRCDPYCINPDKAVLDRMTVPFQHRILLKAYVDKVEKVRRLMRKAHSEWILQVHDEVIYFMNQSAAHEVAAAVSEVMTWKHFFPAITRYNIPLAVDGGVAHNWKDAKGKKPLFHVKAGFNN